MVNSRSKGARGEREFAAFLRERFGLEARRGQQYSGSPDSPDVVTNLDGVHFEVKRVEKFSLDKSMAQAVADAGDAVPVVAHKKNRGEWVLVMRADDLPRLCVALTDALVAQADATLPF